jgi:hypothetical protein
VLCSLPAFGGKRPDEAWLVQQLQRMMATATEVTLLAGESCSAAQILLEPALEAAAEVLARQKDGGWTTRELQVADSLQQEQRVAGTAAATAPAGVLLLHSVREALQAAYSSNVLPAQQLKPMSARVLALLLQYPHVPQPPTLPGLLCAAAEAASASGDISVCDTASQQAQQLQLSRADIAAVMSAALTGAATAAGQGPSSSIGVLQQLWLVVTTATDDDTKAYQPLSSKAASALTTAMATSSPVADLLLGSAAVALPLLVQLLQAAVGSGKQATAVQLLLAHAEQHQLLQQLPPNLLIAALGQGSSTATAASSSGSGALVQQGVAVLLQQGQAPDAAAAAALLPGTAAGEQQWQQLLSWLQEQCSSAPAAAAHSLLCDLLLASARRQSADQTWQLYQLLQDCQGSGSWPAAQQGLPTAVCSALIEQQAAAVTAASNSRVLQLWQAIASLQDKKLSTATLTAIASALVASEQHAAALQLVQ